MHTYDQAESECTCMLIREYYEEARYAIWVKSPRKKQEALPSLKLEHTSLLLTHTIKTKIKFNRFSYQKEISYYKT